VNTPTPDVWIRWSHRCNGWMWSVLRGTTLIVEGCARSELEANTAARAALAKVSP